MRLALTLVALLVGPVSAAPKGGAHKRRTPPPVQAPAPTDYNGETTISLQPTPAVQHKEGEYGGVEPGQTPAATGKKRKAPPKSTLNWVGFEAKDGSANVFFQAAAPFEVTQRSEGQQLVVFLALPRMGPNAWRELDTRFFENPLARIDAKTVGARKTGEAAHGAGIEVRFTFKNAVDQKQATMRTTTEADGQSYVYLSFPPGTPGPANPTTTKPTATPEK